MTHVFPRHTKSLPPRAVRGDGPYLFGADGKQYLDGSGGAAVSCLGHSDPDVIAAIKAQIDNMAFAHTGFFTSDAAESLARYELALALDTLVLDNHPPLGFLTIALSKALLGPSELALKSRKFQPGKVIKAKIDRSLNQAMTEDRIKFIKQYEKKLRVMTAVVRAAQDVNNGTPYGAERNHPF